MLKCVITGGPCGGKTEIMSTLTQKLEARGYKVFIVPETATELIVNGILPGDKISMDLFETFIMEKQLSKEQLYDRAASYYGDKVVIFYDRGIMDNKAYMSKEGFASLLEQYDMSLMDVYGRYDVVLHLVTAAKGAEEFYQWNDPSKKEEGNNAARRESPEEACEMDQKTLDAWIGHPHLRVFDNSTDFPKKISRVVEEVFACLGEPVPKEIERKFLVKKPTKMQLKQLGCISEVNIIQTYLKSDTPNVERRVRQRGTEKDGYSFYYTEKRDFGYGERLEKENRISWNDYVGYLAFADTDCHQIRKLRNCFVFDNHYFELDYYPFSNDYAIMEIEVNDIHEPIHLPPIDVIKEVTGDENYSNHELAKIQKLEP